MITKEMLDAYGCNAVVFTKTDQKAMDDDGSVIDPYNGRADLENRILRHVGPAFREDPSCLSKEEPEASGSSPFSALFCAFFMMIVLNSE